VETTRFDFFSDAPSVSSIELLGSIRDTRSIQHLLGLWVSGVLGKLGVSCPFPLLELSKRGCVALRANGPLAGQTAPSRRRVEERRNPSPMLASRSANIRVFINFAVIINTICFIIAKN
jgi:hypothetical protein